VRLRTIGALAAILLLSLPEGSDVDAQGSRAPSATRNWPAVTSGMKPWTRWWWQGSAVEPSSLSAQLATLARAGLGGVEITPIYGVRGTEDRFIRFLSSEWVRALDHTLAEAARLGLGVDMATGTGWPFGGPWVDDEMAPRSLAHRVWTVPGGQRLTEAIRMQQAPLVRAIGNQVHVVNEGAAGDPPRAAPAQPVIRPGARAIQITDLLEPVSANRNLQLLALEQVKYPRDLPIVAVMAYSDKGETIDLTRSVSPDLRVDWTAPPGSWTVYALFAGWHGKLVERAAPGGEGNVIDHFSAAAITRYLAPFDRAFGGGHGKGIRAFFNDSYEVDDATGEADWTPSLLDEFQKRRGYDLRRCLPALLGRDTEERNARVLADYRETISDLLLDTFTTGWNGWAHGRKSLTRNQAHGSPGSLLDLYAASDIPETEGADVQRFKWATSAAHVAGRRLVSAETATWLGEHFRSTLADVRAAVDKFFTAGVNHIVYHGTAYSPASEPWPGWLFYASVEFTPQNAWWNDFGALNTYITRVQSMLQRGTSDHDVLLYFPLYDAMAIREKSLLTHFGGANPPALGTAFERAATTLQDKGFTYDFISDRQLKHTRAARGGLVTAAGGRYQVIVVPAGRFIPLETLEHVVALGRAGATVIAFNGWPADVAGLGDLDARRGRFKQLLAGVPAGAVDAAGITEVRLGQGRVLQGPDLARLLERAGVSREPMVDLGLQFARRVDSLGRIYFISNPTDKRLDGWVPLNVPAGTATVMEPMHGGRGNGRVRRTAGGMPEIYLQIPAGESLVLATSSSPLRDEYNTYELVGTPQRIAGAWRVRFVTGGPVLPPERSIDRLASWTEFGGDDERRFSGTATYTVSFARPTMTAPAWRIDLGSVRESARVRLNRRDLGTWIGPSFAITIDTAQLLANNTLEVSVTNLSANRIADLDRRGVPWKKFYNVNYPARFPENRGEDGLFTAAGWKPLDSGLLGPVTLAPLRVQK
jgi:alpha-L-rhamnosidase